jgi:hypothetical protein
MKCMTMARKTISAEVRPAAHAAQPSAQQVDTSQVSADECSPVLVGSDASLKAHRVRAARKSRTYADAWRSHYAHKTGLLRGAQRGERLSLKKRRALLLFVAVARELLVAAPVLFYAGAAMPQDLGSIIRVPLNKVEPE